MLFIKRAKILSTRLYEFFYRGGRRDRQFARQACSADQSRYLFRSAEIRIHQAFGEVVVHTHI